MEIDPKFPRKHQSGNFHKDSMARLAVFRHTKCTGTVADQLDSQRIAAAQENRLCLKTMLKIALLCARQDLELRGHDESESSENRGNFKEILSLLASENATLKHRLDSAPSNAKYSSNDIQIDLLKAAAAIDLHGICENVQAAPYFAVIADECRDIAMTEQSSICLKYVCNYDYCIKERFVGFTDVHQLNATSLAGENMRLMGELGVDP